MTRGTIGTPGRYREPAISPDGRTVAVARFDPHVGTDDIWLIDSDRGAASRFTFDPGWEDSPVWSPDGTRIIFASRRGVNSDLYVKSLVGTTSEQLFLSLSTFLVPLDWSRDGRFVVFRRAGLNTHADIWTLPLVGERKPFAVIETPAPNARAQISPDGRWLAYDSDETGTREVYVRPFPGASTGKWRISDHGGQAPKWRRDGQELFYAEADQRLMATRTRTTSHFEADKPLPLFRTPSVGIPPQGIEYDVAPDGRRFLVNAPARQALQPVIVVVNWPATLPH